MKRVLLMMALLGACADDAGIGQASFALSDAAFFRLRIFASPAAVSPEGKGVFDTGCLERQSRTYELTNIPVGNGYAVLYEGFSTASCDAGSKLEIGYRGDVDIQKGQSTFYHVPVYPTGGVAALPENLNISASLAEPIDFCDGDDDCGGSSVCYTAAAPQYFCVPSCQSDADCTGLHPRATCDTGTHWCMLTNPYPLNLSEPRAFGQAATLANGDVLFIGGLKPSESGLGATTHWLERFDARLGLLAPAELDGEDELPAAMFGFAKLDTDRFVAVGGVSALDAIDWDPNDPDSPGFAPQAEWTSVAQAALVVFEPDTGRTVRSELPKAIVMPTVVRLDTNKFFIAGGLRPSPNGVEATRDSYICTLDAQLAATCGASADLVTPRIAAAGACVDSGCTSVLLVGGNVGDGLAEVVSIGDEESKALETQGTDDRIFFPQLCGMDLIGGSKHLGTADPVQPVRLSVEDDVLKALPIVGAAPSVMFGAVAGTGPCYIGGGLSTEGSARADVHVMRDDAFVSIPGASFGQARAGAVAAIIGAGPLQGRVIFGGGWAPPGDAGQAEVVRGLEVFTP